MNKLNSHKSENSIYEQPVFDVAIIGAGPGGLSGAARASKRGMTHILLEASGKHANTIQQYQKRKHVMAEPCVLPLRSDIVFEAGARESILDNWERAITQTDINVRYLAQVTSIEGGSKENFQIFLKSGDSLRTKNIILALGAQGNARRLNAPGEDLPFVQTTLESADVYRNETIVIVGAGDSAIENAIALSSNNRVILINRRTNFSRAKAGNLNRILRAIETDQIECFYETTIDRFEQNSADCQFPGQIVLNTSEGVLAIECHRAITRLGAVPPRSLVESVGVRFVSKELDALPELSFHYESNVPGVYLIGALAGYPLIKQAMNQGYEVIEYILGHPVKPSDHSILQRKLKSLPFGDDVDSILALINQRVRLFRDINPVNLRELVMVSDILTPEPGQEIFTKGIYSTTFYNILQGTIRTYSEIGEVITLGKGQFFGEMSLISGRPRSTTVIAGEDCILLETPQHAIKKLIRMEESVRRGIDKVSILRTISCLLPDLSMNRIRTVSEEAEIHRFAAGEILFHEGDPIDRLYLLLCGSVTLHKKSVGEDVVVGYCAAQNYMDLMEVSGKTHRITTALATVATEAVSIDKSKFDELLASDPKLHRKIQTKRKNQFLQFTSMQAKPEQGQILSFLMDNGIGEATNVMIIDESLCVGCDNCEKACAATHHDISRLDRKVGPSFNSLHIPNSCRHCEHPHCMRDCPPNAIHRLPNGEVYIDATCIGCGNCVENCPYDTIQMAEVSPKLSWLDKLLGKNPLESPKTAVKCDMCKDLKGGPSCVNACPTGAAIRIHGEQAVSLANQKIASRC